MRNAMKPYTLLLPLAAFIQVFMQCGEFPTTFEEITGDRVRTLDFVYRNVVDTTLCEAAPGDSLEVTMLFSGEKVHEIQLSASFNVRTTLYGKIESFDKAPLRYTVRHSTLSDTGSSDVDTFVIRFGIPGDILTSSTFLPEHGWINVLPPELQQRVPASVAAMDKSEVATMLRLSGEQAAAAGSLSSITADSLRSVLSERFPTGIETLLQLFSAQVELTALINNQYTVVSYATVRMHRLFSGLDTTIVCNRNPVITRMGVYRVKTNNLTSFDPSVNSQPYEEIILYDVAAGIRQTGYTLSVEKNESYFLFVGNDAPQQTRSIDGAMVSENHRCEWFYRQYSVDIDSIDAADRMSIVNGSDGPVVPLITASSTSITRCDIWVQVRDEALGPRFYPTGSTVFQTGITFSYSDEYLNK